jgi:hypothetical protein
MRVGLIVGLVGGFVSTAAVAGAGYYGWELFDAGSLEKRFAGFKALEEALDIEVKYQQRGGEAFALDFTLEKVTIVSDDKRLEVDKIEFKRFDWKNPNQPRYSAIAFTGIRVKRENLNSLFGLDFDKALAEIKIDEVVIDGTFAHRTDEEEVEDPKTKRKVKQTRVTVEELKIAIRDLGTATVSLELKDFQALPRATARKTLDIPPIIRLIGERVRLGNVRVVFEDKGFVKLLMDATARDLNQNDLQARRYYFKELQKDASATRSAAKGNQYDADFFRPAMTYVEQYDKRAGFTLVLKPDEPLELRRLPFYWRDNRGGLFIKLGPKLTLAAAPKRADPKKEDPKKKDPKKKKPE